jgi:hypothetical protein
MAELNYTKGEWEVMKWLGERRGYNVLSQTNGLIASIPMNVGLEHTMVEAQANAQLISASPNMYEALKKIQEWLMFDKEITGKDVELYNAQFIKANNLTIKVLAKAEGKKEAHHE